MFLIIGHRGCAANKAENSMESFHLAYESDFSMIELDIHLSKDNRLVVMHDDSVDRTTDGSGKINKLSHTELEKIKIEGKYKIPLLDQVLEQFNNKVDINIEIKDKKVIDELAKLLAKKSIDKNKILISSFNFEALYEVRKKIPDIKIGVLINSPIKLNKALRFAKKISAYSIHMNNLFVFKYHVKKVHKNGFKLFIYTVDDKKKALKLKKIGVDGIFTNFCDMEV